MKIQNLSFDILKSFVVFIESSNMVAAARQLGVSQPLLTKHLQILEEASAQTLFAFEGRRKVPTRYGRAFYHLVKNHFDDLEKDLQKFNLEQANPAQIHIRIAGRKEILETVAGPLKFAGPLSFLPMGGAEVVRSLQEGRIEIGISQHELESHSFIRKPLVEDEFKIVLPESWELKSKKWPELVHELLERPRLSYGESDPLSQLLVSQGLATGPQPHRVFPSWPILVEMIRKKTGWGLVPSLFLKETRSLRILDLPAQAMKPTSFYVYYPRELAKQDWFRDLTKSVHEVFERN